MTQIQDQTRPAVTGTGRATTATLLGTLALVLWAVPPNLGILAQSTGEHLRIDPTTEPDGYYAAVAAEPGLWAVASVGLLLACLLTMAWVPAVWRLSVDRARGWAWAAAVTAALFAFGQAVHLDSWQVVQQAIATAGLPGEQAVAFNDAVDGSTFFTVIFAPFLLGFLLAPTLAAIALWRARVVPVWAIGVAAVSSVVAGMAGDQPALGIAHAVLNAIAFAPALRHVLAGRR